MKLITLLVATVLVSVTALAATSEIVGTPLGQMTYPVWKDGCILAHEAASTEKIAAKVGTVIETTRGTWKCVRVVVDQAAGTIGAAWAPAEK